MNKRPNMILNHVNTLLEKGFRYDKRKFDEFRPVKVTTGISENAEGSARVEIGDTVVFAGDKLSIEKPYPDSPERGNISVNVELLPLSSPKFEPGPPSVQAVEIARVVDRGIRESGALDLNSMCVEPGEKVWTAFIDICTINDAGNLQDAASLATIAALKDTKMPELVEGKINYKQKTDKGLPLSDEPVEVTVCKIGESLIVDPIHEEQLAIDARLTVAITKEGDICALQKGGNMPLNVEDVDEMMKIAKAKAAELQKLL